jgi:hypothetical protein
MLVSAITESMLWHLEVEAHIVLGKIYADHRLLDQAPGVSVGAQPGAAPERGAGLGRCATATVLLRQQAVESQSPPGGDRTCERARNARRLADLSEILRQSMRMMRRQLRAGADRSKTTCVARRFSQTCCRCCMMREAASQTKSTGGGAAQAATPHAHGDAAARDLGWR